MHWRNKSDDLQQGILKDAIMLSKFAAGRGVLTNDLSMAIVRAYPIFQASQELQVPEERAKAEQTLLLETDKTIKLIGFLNIDQIRQYQSPFNKIIYNVARYIAVLLMIGVIILVIPMTFMFNQSAKRVVEIRELDDLIRSYGVHEAGRLVRFFPEKAQMQQSGQQNNANPALDSRSSTANANLNDGSRIESQRDSNLSRLKAHVEFLIKPPRMMDFAQIISDKIWKIFFPNGWTVIMMYYNPTYIRDFDVEDVGSVNRQLKTAENDFVFISTILGSGILPALYGVLGALVFLLRNYIIPSKEALLTLNPIGGMLMRIGLGGVAGVAIGWFQLPQAAQQITLTPFAVAFLAGFGIDVLFSILDRIIKVFDVKHDNTFK